MPDSPPVVSIPGQAGDVETGSIAGRDIHHYGDLPEGLRRFLGQEAEFRRLMLEAMERQARELKAEVENLRRESEIWRVTDESRRKARQEADDRFKATLSGALTALAVVVILAVIVLAALVRDRLGVLDWLWIATYRGIIQ
jgi:hypothetical protein